MFRSGCVRSVRLLHGDEHVRSARQRGQPAHASALRVSPTAAIHGAKRADGTAELLAAATESNTGKTNIFFIFSTFLTYMLFSRYLTSSLGVSVCEFRVCGEKKKTKILLQAPQPMYFVPPPGTAISVGQTPGDGRQQRLQTNYSFSAQTMTPPSQTNSTLSRRAVAVSSSSSSFFLFFNTFSSSSLPKCLCDGINTASLRFFFQQIT